MKYAALLRGINVGGKNKVKMETLREVCSSLGFKDEKISRIAFDNEQNYENTKTFQFQEVDR